MTPRPLALAAILVGGLLAGCAAPQGAATTATPAQAAACRQRADEVYERQNRADVYRSDTYASGTRDAMFSSTGSPAAAVAGLPGRFARDRMLAECLRGVAGNVASTPDAPAPTPTPAPAAAPARPRI
jgi:hypothetical protein